MFLEVKAGDNVWEDYFRDRHGVCQEVFKGRKGAVYAKILWDGLADALGTMGQPVLAERVNARALRSSRKPEFMSEAEKVAMLSPIPTQPDIKTTLQELDQVEVNIIVAALRQYPARPAIRAKIGQLLQRLET